MNIFEDPPFPQEETPEPYTNGKADTENRIDSEIGIQRLHNRIQARAITKLGFKDTEFRVAFGIHSYIEHAGVGESVVIWRKDLAEVLRVGGNEASQLTLVSKSVRKLKKAQRRCGRKIITVTPGKQVGDKWHPAEYLDHYGSLVRQADTRFPDWRHDPEMETELVEWIVDNFPPETETEPDPKPKSAETLPIDEQCHRKIEKLRRLFNQDYEEIESQDRETAVRFAETFTAAVVMDSASLKKTAAARLLVLEPIEEEGPLEEEATTATFHSFLSSGPHVADSAFRGEGDQLVTPLNKGLTDLGGELEPEERLETAKLSRDGQMSEFFFSFISRGYREFFLALETVVDGQRFVVKSDTFPVSGVLNEYPEWMCEADRRRVSFMTRPLSPLTGKKRKDMTPDELRIDDGDVRARSIHLDDLREWQVEKIWDWAGSIFETSPSNFQAIVFVTADYPTFKTLQKRMRRGLASDTDKPDSGATGSFRIPGSLNWKQGRDGCAVRLKHVTYDTSWIPDQLEESGLLAPPEPPPEPVNPNITWSPPGRWKFPDYGRSIQDAPRKKDGVTPDYSCGDLSWSNICQKRDIPYEAAYNELWRLRDALDGKPTNHPGYVRLTINKAYGLK